MEETVWCGDDSFDEEFWQDQRHGECMHSRRRWEGTRARPKLPAGETTMAV